MIFHILILQHSSINLLRITTQQLATYTTQNQSYHVTKIDLCIMHSSWYTYAIMVHDSSMITLTCYMPRGYTVINSSIYIIIQKQYLDPSDLSDSHSLCLQAAMLDFLKQLAVLLHLSRRWSSWFLVFTMACSQTFLLVVQ